MKTILSVLLVGCVSVANAQVSDTAYGDGALRSNAGGNFNSAFGTSALASNTASSFNTAVGMDALGSADGGVGGNTGVGYATMLYLTIGSYNTASGFEALYEIKTGSYNAAFGSKALSSNAGGQNNLALGGSSLFNNTSGSTNTAVGSKAFFSNAAGSGNIGLGYQAGFYPVGSNNIDIGAAGSKADDSIIRIGTAGTHKAAYLAGVRGVMVTGGQAVVVSATGQLGIASTKTLVSIEDDVRRIAREENEVLLAKVMRLEAEIAELRRAP